MRTATSCPTAKQTSTLRKSPGVPGSKLRGVIRGCGGFLPLLQYRSVMNTSGTLIEVSGISKQKPTCTTWPLLYLSWEEAQAAHSLHVREVGPAKKQVFNADCAFCLVCRLMLDREILQEPEIQLHLQLWEAGENENKAFPRREQQSSISHRCGTNSCLAAGRQGLITTCRGWGSCTQCRFPRNRETKKEYEMWGELRGEENSFFQKVSKEIYPEGCILQEWQTEWPQCDIFVC